MRRSTNLLIVLFIALLALSGCTRDRAEPEPTPTATVPGELPPPAEPQVTQAEAIPTATPVPEPTATPEPEREIIPYTVQEGDILSALAERYNTTSEEIRALNFLQDDNIQVGAILRIPLGPGATADGIPTPTPEPYVHTVAAGDTLYSIAVEYNVSATEIVAANGLTDQNALFVGQDLLIPGYQPSASTGSGEAGGSGTSGGTTVIHTVQPGEGLLQIARIYDVSYQDIVEANNLTDANLIRPGQELTIPGASVPEEASGQRVHTVQSGETLSGIAAQYGITMTALMQANGIADADRIFVGQVLVIP